MDAFVNFVKEYGALILAALSVVVGLIAAIIKQRPKTIEEFTSVIDEVLANIPYVVSIQELKYGAGHGIEKKSAAISEALNEIARRLGRKLSNEESDYCITRVSSMVESVLDAPQKKGGSK